MGQTDPILVSVLQRRLKAITEEMGLTLLRTGRSPILNEARDFVTGLYDAQGRMLEQTEYIPVLAFAVEPVCKRIIAEFDGDIHPGDVFLHNDVFSGGNQNNDVAVFKPIFVGDDLVAWAACKGHQADIGGNVAGGYNPEAREVWQEAFRIPAVRIFSKGERVRDVWTLIFANIRLKIVEEDIKAQIGGCVVGERAIQALVSKHGLGVFRDHLSALFDATERMVRSAISKMPDGKYQGHSQAFYDGLTEGSIMDIALAVTINGHCITFDFTGSSGQTRGFVNAPFAATASAVLLSFLMIIDPNIPHNDGLTRPISIVNPEGSFLNAAFPAATTFGNSLTGPTSDAIFKAFAQIVPEIVTAGWNRMLGFTITGQDPEQGERFVDILFLALKGGSGAAYGVDGYDHIGLINCAGGIQAQDYEMLELQTPNTLIRHEYSQDSAGAGKWRGGLGVETELEIGGTDVLGVAFGDGAEEEARAFGLFGGNAGSLNKLILTYPDGRVVHPRSKEIIRDIPPGTRYVQIAGGGGGYGPPRERDPKLVRQDLANGILSAKAAMDDYGVCDD
jgi:N-methylhydantoinase B